MSLPHAYDFGEVYPDDRITVMSGDGVLSNAQIRDFLGPMILFTCGREFTQTNAATSKAPKAELSEREQWNAAVDQRKAERKLARQMKEDES